MKEFQTVDTFSYIKKHIDTSTSGTVETHNLVSAPGCVISTYHFITN